MLYRAHGKAAVCGPIAGRDDEEAAFRSAATSEINPSVPDDLNALCVDLLRRDPSERPTGEEILRRLGGQSYGPSSSAAGGLGVRSRPSSAVNSSSLNSRRLVWSRPARSNQCRFRSWPVGPARARWSSVSWMAWPSAVKGRLGGRCYEQESVAYKAIDTLIDSLTRFLRLHRHEAEG
jgi:hypothetical protein